MQESRPMVNQPDCAYASDGFGPNESRDAPQSIAGMQRRHAWPTADL